MRNPTIRTLAGSAAPRTLDAARTALLVIDFQNEYFHGKLPIPDGPKALANTLRLIERADADGIEVFHVQHVAPAANPVFADGSASSQIHAGIRPAAHHQLVRKTSVSVFPTTDIDTRLKRKQIDTLIITGLMTHACVAGAARDAVPLGYKVIVVDDASATRDIDAGNGETISHRALHRAALTSIEDTFGDVMTTDAILGLLAK
ncbi:isochorismatase family protein [Paraburkholderia sp. SARCC-3016]|uniref:cysteine hydrolase family protein n=1 Tax=Paraburkholderia sp. SARCC-3016 TaxID=3058611 RepID=UPI00280A4ABF|nr:isochorismatase family protein [Paraburkholderia sp. SARCC-3016]MDQ7981995.1 isochorismatase family protein [Paraburkholderia sp. SARCC-3016]